MADGNKFIGSVLILTGTVIGAGMLALPIVCAAHLRPMRLCQALQSKSRFFHDIPPLR